MPAVCSACGRPCAVRCRPHRLGGRVGFRGSEASNARKNKTPHAGKRAGSCDGAAGRAGRGEACLVLRACVVRAGGRCCSGLRLALLRTVVLELVLRLAVILLGRCRCGSRRVGGRRRRLCECRNRCESECCGHDRSERLLHCSSFSGEKVKRTGKRCEASASEHQSRRGGRSRPGGAALAFPSRQILTHWLHNAPPARPVDTRLASSGFPPSTATQGRGGAARARAEPPLPPVAATLYWPPSD